MGEIKPVRPQIEIAVCSKQDVQIRDYLTLADLRDPWLAVLQASDFLSTLYSEPRSV